ncbi:hypothetical protein KDH_03640 [Dictyobacter sp. S3.2.2.5]|uniref:MFS transporter n=1 Tax=Dictyobacter halimunensis TaxID=3026934 RepID=A0ABQ6FIS3_9CHLR|nr:hypothetical protein KDH_03640 [Dictyobacter sp. S3.2.2.5]
MGYLFVHTVPVFFIMALLVTAGGRIFFAASASLIVDIATPRELARWFGLVGVIRNVGLGIGGLLAGIVLATHNPDIYHMLISASSLCYLLAASLLLHLSEPGQRDYEQVEKVPYKAILQHRQFIFFLISSISFPLCSMMLATAFPVYVTEAVHAPDWLPGPALLLNSLLVIGCQTFMVRLMEPFRRTRTLGLAALMWGISCGCFALALFIPPFLVVPYLFLVVAIHTLASILYGPTTSSLVADLGPVALRGRYLATYEFSWGVASALTPALFSNLYVVTPSLPWLFLAALVSVSGMSLLWLERRLPARVVWAKKQDSI